jgi:hypothetical protein
VRKTIAIVAPDSGHGRFARFSVPVMIKTAPESPTVAGAENRRTLGDSGRPQVGSFRELPGLAPIEGTQDWGHFAGKAI